MSHNSGRSSAFYGYHRTVILILICLVQFSIPGIVEQLKAQVAPPDGLRENKANVYALTKASIVTSPGNRINRGTVHHETYHPSYSARVTSYRMLPGIPLTDTGNSCSTQQRLSISTGRPIRKTPRRVYARQLLGRGRQQPGRGLPLPSR